VCIVLAAGLWGLWLLALGASLYLSFYAMSLVGLGLATAALAAAAGALASVGVYALSELEGARLFYAYARRSGVCQLDEGLSAELGVEVYKCAGWFSSGSSALFPRPHVVVDSEAYSEEEQRAVAYHEHSHIRRRDAAVEAAARGAAKAPAVAVVFQLALAAGFDKHAYIAAAAVASLIWLKEVAEAALGEEPKLGGREELVDFAISLIFSLTLFSLPAALLGAFLPPGPAPQIGPLDALVALLASAGAYAASRLVSHASELLADVEAALAAGVGPALGVLAKVEEVEGVVWGELKRRLVESGAKYPTLRYLVHRLLDTHPPAAVRIRLIRLCRT